MKLSNDQERRAMELASEGIGTEAFYDRVDAIARELIWLRDECEKLKDRPIGDVIIAEIFSELERATKKFPTWPTDPLHALAVLSEEYGELAKEMLQFVYEPHKTSREDIHKEAIQTAAMAIRLAMNLSEYDYKPGPQHTQAVKELA